MTQPVEASPSSLPVGPAEVARLATIGVYGFTSEQFIETLRRAGIGLVLDVRQRRGVRGSEYAWANSLRLQNLLRGAGIAYEHHRELAPTTELRQLQYREDKRLGVGKRSRTHLASAYVEGYCDEILSQVDLRELAVHLRCERPAALMCVEREPESCHRSLVAARLGEILEQAPVHLLPAEARSWPES